MVTPPDLDRQAAVADELVLLTDEVRSLGANLRAGVMRKCVSNLYYAGLHAAGMLLAAHGLSARTHEGVQRLFAAHFVRSGDFPKTAARDLSVLYGRRQAADYQGFVEFDEAEVREGFARLRPLVEGATTRVRASVDGVDFAPFDQAWAATTAEVEGDPRERDNP